MSTVKEHYRGALLSPEGKATPSRVGQMVRTLYSPILGVVVEEIGENLVRVLWPEYSDPFEREIRLHPGAYVKITEDLFPAKLTFCVEEKE